MWRECKVCIRPFLGRVGYGYVHVYIYIYNRCLMYTVCNFAAHKYGVLPPAVVPDPTSGFLSAERDLHRPLLNRARP